jgi:hypothetical protein
LKISRMAEASSSRTSQIWSCGRALGLLIVEPS